MAFERIQDRAQGRWRGILESIGVASSHLSGRPGPCPFCRDGKDRFRFDDKGGSGSWFCNTCEGGRAGNGVDFVMRYLSVDFASAKAEIERHIGAARVEVRKATANEDVQRDKMAALWGRAQPLDGSDIASRYLQARGIYMASWPAQLRWLPDLPFFDDEKKKSTLHPAMLAKFAAPDGSCAILHRTYLAEPGVKADLPKARMLMPGRVPVGGAVRLGLPADTMGIAEGIETALSAALLFDIPVWSALTAGGVVKWQPPAACRNVLIFGEHDMNFAGQHAAYSLAYRLKTDVKTRDLGVEVRVPDESGSDWNDVRMAQLEMNHAQV